MNQSGPRRGEKPAFTLIELLVVIGIITLLVALLIPMAARVRGSVQITNTQAQLASLGAAIEQYYGDYRAYPGPLGNDQIRKTGATGAGWAPSAFASGFACINADGFESTLDVTKITMSENLVLGLLGGLRADSPSAGTFRLVYDPSAVGRGPLSVNPASPKPGKAYMEPVNLSWKDQNGKKSGKYDDEGGAADDTIIPEFLDRFSSPMPVLYLRARVAAPGIVGDVAATANDIKQYDIGQVVAYTGPTGGKYIGTDKRTPDGMLSSGAERTAWESGGRPHGLNSLGTGVLQSFTGTPPPTPPYNLSVYLSNPTSTQNVVDRVTGSPRKKDQYILISAGRDRVYGTNDDITNFGPVRP